MIVCEDRGCDNLYMILFEPHVLLSMSDILYMYIWIDGLGKERLFVEIL